MVHITKTKTKGRSSQKSNKNKISYTKYANALSYLVSETPLGTIIHKFSKLPKSLKRPNKKSVANIKNEYKKARTELVKIGFELPNVTQLASAWEANLEYEDSITAIHNVEAPIDNYSTGDVYNNYWNMRKNVKINHLISLVLKCHFGGMQDMKVLKDRLIT